MKLVHLSDVHIHDELIGNSDPVEQFRRCLAHVEKHFSDADAIVLTGDLTHDGRTASYERLRELVADTPLKLHLLLGNHDHRGRFRAAFPDVVAYGFFPHKHMTLQETAPLVHSANERIDQRDLTHAAVFFRDVTLRLLG